MPVSKGNAQWNGDLRGGEGRVSVDSGAVNAAYSFRTRFEDGIGTNPEELIAAAHAGCFSMALSAGLGRAGFSPQTVKTAAHVHLEKGEAGFSITRIELETEAVVPEISNEDFQKHAEDAKKNCPVSKALAGPQISLKARLV